MIWFERMCCCHLQREEEAGVGQERREAVQAGGGLCPRHRQGWLSSSNAPGATPRGCHRERAAEALTVQSLHITRLHGCCTGGLGAIICRGQGNRGSAGTGGSASTGASSTHRHPLLP